MKLLHPSNNYPVDVEIITSTKTVNDYGEVVMEIESYPTSCIFVDLGKKRYRTAEGLKVVDMAEVHVVPSDADNITVGSSYVLYNGLRYRITDNLDMRRITGTVLLEVTREDDGGEPETGTSEESED